MKQSTSSPVVLRPGWASHFGAVADPRALEAAALIGMAAMLPLLETPKTILFALYTALWFWNRRRGDFGGPWDGWDTLILIWLASPYASAVFAGIDYQQWGFDPARYVGTLWMIKRGGYGERTLMAVVVALAAGTLVTLAWGYYRLSPDRKALGLRSVGHVNQSAIYLSIVFGMTLMATHAWWRAIGAAWRIAAGVSLIVFVVSLFVMLSRAALGAAAVTAVVLLITYTVRRRRGLKPLALAALIVCAVGATFLPQVIERHQKLMAESAGDLLFKRDRIWNAGLIAWREFPLFGVGVGNYGQVNEERVRAWKAGRGERFDKQDYYYLSHAHSLYINTLTERGAVGLAALLAVLAAWAWSLVRYLPGADASPFVWTAWGGAASAWLVNVLIGFVNTPLHHEHALLSTILLGGWLALRSHFEHPPGYRPTPI
jgi:O-antigen ligase